MKQVQVLLFAVLREKVQQSEFSHPIADGMSVGELWRSVVQTYPSLAPYEASTSFAVNLEYVDGDYGLEDGDEVAFIPPVSGG